MDYSKELLREIYQYDKESGKLYYKIDLAFRINAGDEVGSNNDGYLQTTLFGRMMKVHRIIWKMETGESPEVIDHIDHNRSNNRLENLRNVSSQENSKNMSELTCRNTTGIFGIYKERDRFVTSVRVSGKVKGKKRFRTLEEAIEHRDYLYVEYDFHPNHGKL